MTELIQLLSLLIDKFGPIGLLLGYFVIKDIVLWYDNRQKKGTGKWVDLAQVRDKIIASVDGMVKIMDKLMLIEEKQNDLLKDNLEQGHANGKSLDEVKTLVIGIVTKN